MSKGARFRALMTQPPLVLPVVDSVLMARLCELEGFQAAFMGGSGAAALLGVPNVGVVTISEVLDYMSRVIEKTDLPILADAEDGGGSPVLVYRTVQAFERVGAAVVMIEDTVGPESHFQGKGAPLATKDQMVDRVKAAVDARKDPNLVILVRSDAPSKGYPAQTALDLGVACAEAGADAFYFSGFSLAEQTKARDVVQKPLMIGGGTSTTPSQWYAAGVSMAFYHVENVGIGAIHTGLKELKATGKYEGAAKMLLPGDLRAQLVDADGHRARARKYRVMP